MFSRRILQMRHNNSISYILLGAFYFAIYKIFYIVTYYITLFVIRFPSVSRSRDTVSSSDDIVKCDCRAKSSARKIKSFRESIMYLSTLIN